MVVDTKPFYLSLTFWALVVTAIAGLLDKWGYKLNDDLRGELAGTLLKIAELAGLAVAMFGRWRSERPLSLAGGTTAVISKTPSSLTAP